MSIYEALRGLGFSDSEATKMMWTAEVYEYPKTASQVYVNQFNEHRLLTTEQITNEAMQILSQTLSTTKVF